MDELKCWFVGVDWASENHRVRITDGCGKRLGERDFAHGGAGLAEMAAWLTSVTGAEPSAIHVAIEIPHGPIVETLLERGFNVYAINPKQLDRFCGYLRRTLSAYVTYYNRCDRTARLDKELHAVR